MAVGGISYRGRYQGNEMMAAGRHLGWDFNSPSLVIQAESQLVGVDQSWSVHTQVIHSQSLNILYPNWWQVSSVSIVKLDLRGTQIIELSGFKVVLEKNSVKVTVFVV